ncbi:Rv2253/PknI dimerization domain-containing protein [Mycolicibacterium sphagni]|uniref:Secreted protein n=1 Tax=Mycolicibacterium sphagni TaxID=1786 RepID=A0A255DM17_9MYCO|nr:hypothetical protein [Mycolicibacterium sphagni]MCV7175367.1 hypothetical protein [Mycolicibacterium sphagni]OYN76693.1 hypothetical protein CG716_21120 [Mycolicibacterium sphagni]
MTGRAATIAVAVAMAMGEAAAPAGAQSSAPLNGRYIAISNGDWAQTNDSYHNEVTVRSTWTISSTCTQGDECTGQVSSDLGWTAPLRKQNDTWIVDRDLPDWETCADGTTAPGHQKIRFWRVNAAGMQDYSDQSPIFAGEDKTVGPSGACGKNQWLTIRMPFSLQQID